jgi:TRAP-type C4-dicarboxylate transport system permease large subunit
VPVAAAFGVDPVHLGVIMLASLELGYLAPPIGLNLLMSATRFHRPMLEVARATAPMLTVLAIGVAMIAIFPQMTLALPQWFASRGAH